MQPRPQRTPTQRIARVAWTITVFIVLGVLASATIASITMSIGLSSSTSPVNLQPGAAFAVPRRLVREFGEPEDSAVFQGIYLDRCVAAWLRPHPFTPDTNQLYAIYLDRGGLPVRSFALMTESDTSMKRAGPANVAIVQTGAIRWKWGSKEVVVPLIPVWPGFAINALVWACAIYLVFRGPKLLRTRWRIRNGNCVVCGYSRKGLPADAKCPECATLDDRSNKPESELSATK